MTEPNDAFTLTVKATVNRAIGHDQKPDDLINWIMLHSYVESVVLNSDGDSDEPFVPGLS